MITQQYQDMTSVQMQMERMGDSGKMNPTCARTTMIRKNAHFYFLNYSVRNRLILFS